MVQVYFQKFGKHLFECECGWLSVSLWSCDELETHPAKAYLKKYIFSAAQQADCKMLKSAKPSVYLLSADTRKRSQSFSSKKENFDSSSADLKLTWQSSCYCCYCSSLLSSSYSMSFGYLLKFAGFSRPALSHRATSQLPAEIRAQECVTAEEIAPVKW